MQEAHERVLPIEGGASFPLQHRLFRAAWNLTWVLLVSWTPPPLHKWRRLILCCFGARIAPTARVYSTAKIWYPPNLVMEDHACLGPFVTCYSMAQIKLGRYATVSQRTHLCAGSHDIEDPGFRVIARPISIGERAWIAAEAFVGPGVTVGEGAVVGARSVLFKDLLPWEICVGNPARVIGRRSLRGANRGDPKRCAS